MNEIQFLSTAYGRQFSRAQKNIELAGSPQRSVRRFLVQDGAELFVAEQIRPSQVAWRQEIGKILCQSRQAGLAAIPYLKTREGKYVAAGESDFWQVAPFVQSQPLPRPQYVFDAWRGEVLADFLVGLGGANFAPFQEPRFSLRRYILSLLETLALTEPELCRQVQPFFPFIDELLRASEEAPRVFSHGDFHPLNVLWGQDGIAGVIDWEFCGYKCQLYDVANLVGCIGIEHPDFLEERLVRALFGRLGRSGYADSGLIRELPLLILALRFAWLSEWLRAKDRDMIELELAYMDFLREHRVRLGEKWAIFST